MAPNQLRSILLGLIIIISIAGCAGMITPAVNQAVVPPTSLTPDSLLSRQTSSPLPTITSTVQPASPTLVSSRTPTITPTPPVQVPTSEPVLIETIQYLDVPTQTLSEVQFDFVYVSQGIAYRWSHSENQVYPLLEEEELSSGSVIAMAADADQNSILLHRTKGVAANGVELYDLLLHRYESGDSRPLLQETGRLYTLRVSPDGMWLAYFDQVGGGKVRILNLETGGDPDTIGECGAGETGMCGGMAWSPDSRTLLWTDERGVWGYASDRQELNKLMQPEVAIQDSQGLTSTVQVQFSNPVWSPFGRYILAQVRPDRSRVSWLDIIDVRTGRAAEVPGTFRMQGSPSPSTWLLDGRILIVDETNQSTGLKLEIFQPHPTRVDLLLGDDEIDLSFPDLFSERQGAESLEFISAVPISSRDLALRYIPSESGADTGLFLIDLEYGVAQHLTVIPHDTVEITWSPDGNQAILAGKHGSVLMLDREQKQLYNLREVLPASADQFLWIKTKRFVGAS